MVKRTWAWALLFLSPFSLVAQSLKLEGKVAFVEGPAWHPSGNVYFSDIPNNRILRRDPVGVIHVFRTPSGRANGLLFGPQQRLHACEGGGEGGNRRVTRLNADGTIEVLTDRFDGKRYNSPNDLTFHNGRLYFTDPRYGDRSDIEQMDDQGQTIEGVYRLDPDGAVSRILTHEVDRPNGIAISRDGEFLFLADNNNSERGANRKLWRWNLDADGNPDLASQKLLYDWKLERGPDGMCLGPDDRLYVTAGLNYPTAPSVEAKDHPAGVTVFTQEGEKVAFYPVPNDAITNCTFGGPDGKTLFITAGHRLWSLDLSREVAPKK
ncbi:MAG: SMP-30/gluconolactonase/LRE family protein [Verrucomicrobiota bacterium]